MMVSPENRAVTARPPTAAVKATGPNISSAAVADFGGASVTGPAFTVVPALVLGPLTDNGGLTKTMLPQNPGPAIDTGSDAATAGLTTDQRGPGYFRVSGG